MHAMTTHFNYHLIQTRRPLIELHWGGADPTVACFGAAAATAVRGAVGLVEGLYGGARQVEVGLGLPGSGNLGL